MFDATYVGSRNRALAPYLSPAKHRMLPLVKVLTISSNYLELLDSQKVTAAKYLR